MMEAMPNMLDMHAMKRVRFRRGTLNPMIVRPPENRPEAPRPATARPTIKVGEFFAVAHMTDPTRQRVSEVRCPAAPWSRRAYFRKRASAEMNVNLTLKYL